MMSLELPHINILSKIDLVETQGELAFNLEYYSEVCLLCFLNAEQASSICSFWATTSHMGVNVL